MKGYIVFITAAIYCICLLSQTNAQGSSKKDSPVFSDELSRNSFVREHSQVISTDGEKLYLNNINTKAIIDFKERCGVENELWQRKSDGALVATGSKNETSYVIHYNKKGRWEATLKGYKEDKMPFDIRDIVKRNYYDYAITYVNEIETTSSNGKPTYMVHIQFKRSAKIIRVSNGEMDTWLDVKIQ